VVGVVEHDPDGGFRVVGTAGEPLILSTNARALGG
jgi:hypothetical protein